MNNTNYQVCPICKEMIQTSLNRFEVLACSNCKQILIKFVKNHSTFLVTLKEYRELQEY